VFTRRTFVRPCRWVPGISRHGIQKNKAASFACVEALEGRRFFHGGADIAHSATIEAAPLSPQAVSSAGWKQAAAAPLKLFEAMGAVANDNLYVFAGFFNTSIDVTRRAEVFDPAANRWSALAEAPIPESHVGTTTDGRTIYFAGGFRGDWKGENTPTSSDFWMYDTETAAWSQGPSLPDGRGAGGLVLIDRTLHFFGGMIQGGVEDSGSHWTLDLDNQNAGWTAKADMPDPRNHLGYAALGGKVYAIGGQHVLDEANGMTATVNVYDPATDTWSDAAALPRPRSHLHNSTFVYGDRIYCVGGTISGAVSDTAILTYDPVANQWLSIGRLPAPRAAAVARAVGDRLVVTTGTPTGISPQSTTYTRALNTFAGGSAVGTADLTAEITSPPPASVLAGTRGSAVVRITNSGGDRFRSDANVTLFLSTDAIVDQADAGLVIRNVRLNLQSEKSKSVKLKFDYAENAGGTYFLLTRIDPGDPAAEATTANNFAEAASTIDVTPRTFDLVGTISDPSRRGLAPGGRSSANVTLSNEGNSQYAGSITFTVAAKSALDSAETVVATITRDFRLSPQKQKRVKVALPFPVDLSGGAYFLTLNVDSNNAITESDETNNNAQNATPFNI
jgi:hypothetical protein